MRNVIFAGIPMGISFPVRNALTRPSAIPSAWRLRSGITSTNAAKTSCTETRVPFLTWSYKTRCGLFSTASSVLIVSVNCGISFQTLYSEATQEQEEGAV